MSKSRISTFESEPLDPATSLRHWDTIESSEYSTGPYNDQPAPTPYRSDHRQQFAAEDFSGHGESFSSPEDFTGSATSGPLGYSPLDFTGPRLSTLLPSSLDVGTYSIPPPPGPPRIPVDTDDEDYQRVKTDSYIGSEEPYGDQGGRPRVSRAGLGTGLGRETSMARRVSKRIIAAVRRPRSGWISGTGGEAGAIDEESALEETKLTGYARVDEADEDIGFDLDFFTAGHVPAAAAQAMQSHGMDTSLIYTGECSLVKI